ncbi:MAG: hypothetical protein ACI9TH_001489 [Kiritimatiellia bacterium]|jgi:hypothetical protein
MKYLLMTCICISALSVAAEEGFTSIFDGKTLTGWTPAPGGAWEVKEGAILGTSPKSEPRHGILISDASYKDFIVRTKFRVTKGDSGFYFRVKRVNSNVSVNGFQVEVDSSQETGGLYETGGRAWVVKPTEEEIPKKNYVPSEWTDLEVHAEGKNVTVKINGVVTSKLTDDPGRTEGPFGLQLHGGMDMHVEFKDLRIKTL